MYNYNEFVVIICNLLISIRDIGQFPGARGIPARGT